ncbi:hypothetical protein ABTX34_20185 [Streptomyces sp. NPDC096538]|uniref:hypothetical protein n=1 Tax=Streptomyces sp. NPDC096538 TaxID=3155427 RepID=UPI0033257535
MTGAGAVPVRAGVEDARPAGERRRVANSLLWAGAVTAGLLLGAAVASWVTWLGAVVGLAAVAVAACLVGGAWHRSGAALTVSFAGFALMLFATPAVYEGYMGAVGEPVDAVVLQVVDEDRRRGPDLFCTLQELDGERRVHRVSQLENCFGQAKAGDRVTITEDPLGLLDPRMPNGPGQEDSRRITLAATVGLTALVLGTTAYAGLRRRGR